jgi:hypothetical protein
LATSNSEPMARPVAPPRSTPERLVGTASRGLVGLLVGILGAEAAQRAAKAKACKERRAARYESPGRRLKINSLNTRLHLDKKPAATSS